MPVQVWATWFPRDDKPQSFVQGFPLASLDLSARARNPFFFRIGNNGIEENSCRGDLAIEGHAISWDLHYCSTVRFTLSNKGWIGFSRSPHSDALFSGRITLDGRSFAGNPLGFGVQGHNCGYKHRSFWIWTHAYFPQPGRPPSTLEALVYDMPLGLIFGKAMLWHEGQQHILRNLQAVKTDPDQFRWNFSCFTKDGIQLEAAIDGTGPSLQRLFYQKTDCSGSFEVLNNSLARATTHLRPRNKPVQILETANGVVLEMGGRFR
jgi:hypothetical protein